MKRDITFLNVLVGITYLVMVVVNGLANALPFNGVSTGQISDAYPNLFAPAAITFSIWGLIYLLLAAYTLYQFGVFRGGASQPSDELLRKVNGYFVVSSVANAAWMFCWHYGLFGLTVVLMVVILTCLARIADTLNRERLSSREKLFFKVPFGVYFGWITVATIANITTFLVRIGWGGFGIPEQGWMIVVLLVGVAIGAWRMLKDRNIAYGLTIVWAYSGIWFKHTSASGFGGAYEAIIVTVIACVVLLLIANGLVVLRGKKLKAL